MKRATSLALALSALMAGAALCACEHQESTAKVNPRVDGLTPEQSVVDLSIFEDQRELHRKLVPPPPAPVVPATAPAATEAGSETTTAPAEGGAPETTPPGSEAPPPPPPPGG